MSQETDLKKILQAGINAARAGHLEQARSLLNRVLNQKPDHILALFWLAYAAPTPRKSIELLERILDLQPDNRQAQAGLAWAEHCLATNPSAPPATAKSEDSSEPAVSPSPETDEAAEATDNETIDAADDEAPVSDLPEEFTREQFLSQEDFQNRAHKGVLAHRARRTIDPLLMVLLFIGVAAVSIMAGWAALAAPPEALATWPPGRASAAGEPALSFALDVAPTLPAASAIDIEIEAEADFSLASAEPVSDDWLAPPLDETALISALEIPETESVGPGRLDLLTVDNLSYDTIFEVIAPADTLLTGPRLFVPVDEALLPYQPNAPDEKWIEVNVTTQRVTAWEGNVPVMSFLTSTGLPNTPTVLGQYNIYWKLESTLMTGPGYYLPDVPYTMYFYGGYALHGAYWHDNFGEPMSHGCVNLTPANAQTLFEWADPVIPPGQTQVLASDDNPGTLVVVRD